VNSTVLYVAGGKIPVLVGTAAAEDEDLAADADCTTLAIQGRELPLVELFGLAPAGWALQRGWEVRGEIASPVAERTAGEPTDTGQDRAADTAFDGGDARGDSLFGALGQIDP
jgi:hypothetical protein